MAEATIDAAVADIGHSVLRKGIGQCDVCGTNAVLTVTVPDAEDFYHEATYCSECVKKLSPPDRLAEYLAAGLLFMVYDEVCGYTEDDVQSLGRCDTPQEYDNINAYLALYPNVFDY